MWMKVLIIIISPCDMILIAIDTSICECHDA